MTAKNEISWASVCIGVVFCILAGLGAGMSVQTVLHARPGWVIPFYAVVVGIFTGISAIVLSTILTAVREK